MSDRTRMFGLNMYLIIGAVLLLAFLLVFALFGITALRALLWRRRQRRAEREQEALGRDADGRPLPPAGRGLCDRCGRVYDLVYYCPSGARRCPRCYAVSEPRP